MSQLCKLYFDRTGSIFVKRFIDHYLYFKNDNKTTWKLEPHLLENGDYIFFNKKNIHILAVKSGDSVRW